MNKIYSLIWNAASCRWVITSELSSKQKKGSSRSMLSTGVSSVGKSAKSKLLQGLSALLLTSAASSAFAGTCIQQDALGTGSVTGTGSSAAATCGAFSIAIGAGSGAVANNFGVAVGDASNSTGNNSVAVGRQSAATEDSATAVGQGANALAIGASAFGNSSQATGLNSTAIGVSANANQTSAVAIGSHAQATAVGAVAIGGNTAGTSQSFAADGVAIGGQSVVGNGATSGIAIGRASAVNNTYGIALGDASTAGNSAIAMGRNASATGTSSISIGTGNNVSGNNSGAFGDPSTITGANSYSFGNNNTVSADNAFALGNNITINTGLNGAVALGNNSTVAAANATPTGTVNGTTYNFAGGAPAAGSVVSVGSVGGERQVTHVAAGQVSATSTDAINGSQLFATNQAVGSLGGATTALGNSLVTSLGGGVTYNTTTGALSGFTSNINGVSTTGAVGAATAQTTVSGALDELNTNVNNTANVAVKYDSVGGNTITLGATGGAGATQTVKITNLTAGTLSGTSTDAVNGSQLFATNNQISNIINNGAGVKYFHSNSTLADSSATGTDSTAIGPAATASQQDSIALGNGANASFANSIALGSGSVTSVGAQNNYNAYRLAAPQTSIGEVGIGSASGNRKITGLAAGSNDNDAVNVAQLTAVGNQVDQNTSDLVVLGGRVTNVEQVVNNLNAGGGVKYFHTNSTANDSVASGQNSVAVGPNAQASGNNAIALGNNAAAQADGSVAVGSGASDNGRGAETYTGKYSNAANSSVGTVSVGNAATGDTRTVSNVADGSQATDAVNVRQLDGAVAESKQYTDTSIANLNNSVGNADGRIITSEQNINNLQQGTDGMFQVNNTAQAAKPKPTGVNSLAAGAGAGAAGKNSTALGNGAQANNANSVALGNGSVTDRDNTVSVGSVGNERQIANVGTGTRDTDAVNLGQLNNSLANSTSSANSYTDNKFNQLSGDLDKQKKVLSAGIAGAMAMASLPQPSSAGANMMALGGASFHGESAISLGASHLSENGRWVTKAQINTNTQNNVGWGVGVGFQF